jgi:hypothetical protein
LRKPRLVYGDLPRIGEPYSVRPIDELLYPPSDAVPPSGTDSDDWMLMLVTDAGLTLVERSGG